MNGTLDAGDVLAYLGAQRWYAGTSAPARITEHLVLGWLRAPQTGLGVRVELVSVESAGAVTTYQLPLSYRASTLDPLEHARVGQVDIDDRTWQVYDAAHDHDAVGVLLAGFHDGGAETGGLRYESRRDAGLDRQAPVVLLTGEQSNTSLVVDERAMLKLFRRVAPGRNPDIEVLDALSEDYSDIVPRLYGWLRTSAELGQDSVDLAILQAFLRTATEGWDSARASVRDLLATPDVRPAEAGGDFGGEAERLGEVTRQVHDGMARLLPNGTWTSEDLGALADRFTDHFDGATTEVPQLAPHRPAVLEAYDAVRDLPTPVPVQRVHGDLHLGQTLRTSIGWRLIDFEGEPARPLAERTGLDSPLRDVAGMVRSFDYAAQSVLAQVGPVEGGERAAADWTAHTTASFLRGYGAPASADEGLLLHAYEVHKSVYEAVYESRHRPGWIHIPLRALPV